MEFSDRNFSLILRHFRVFSAYRISQICTQVLNAGFWMLESERWTLDSGLTPLDLTPDWFRTESELSF